MQYNNPKKIYSSRPGSVLIESFPEFFGINIEHHATDFSMFFVLQMIFNCLYVTRMSNYVSEREKKDLWVGLLNSNGGIICSKITVSSLFQLSNYITVIMTFKYYGKINILPK